MHHQHGQQNAPGQALKRQKLDWCNPDAPQADVLPTKGEDKDKKKGIGQQLIVSCQLHVRMLVNLPRDVKFILVILFICFPL